MKTLIVGTGVIGAIYGWALHEAGNDVTHYVRMGKTTRYAGGVEMDVLDERKGHPANVVCHYPMRVTETVCPEDGYELVIFPVNADQLNDALRDLVPHTGDAILLTFTSNWKGTAEIDAILQNRPYLMGYADGGGTVRADGLYWVNLGAEVHLGAPRPGNEADLDKVVKMFTSADMKPDVQKDILRWLWVHNATTVGFSAGFARNPDMQAFLKDSATLKACVESTRELLALCEKRGANLKDYPEISYMGWPSWLVISIMRWMWSTNKSMIRYTSHASSAGSLREARYHLDAMLASAEELGVQTPVLRELGSAL
jgi:2-dehydropantoate 2-reductase